MSSPFAPRFWGPMPVVAAPLALAMSLAFVAACQPTAERTTRESGIASLEGPVRAASLAWDDAHNAGDLNRLMRLYSDDAVSMPYGRPALEGRTEIEADFRDFFTTFTAHHQTTIVALEVVGDWAIERGAYQSSATPNAGGVPMRESGKHIVIRRKIDGSWKVQWEIWNTDTPPSVQ